MRIISGKKRGAVLAAPDGGEIRPSADRVREGLFNILAGGKHGAALESPVVADVFAGTGMLGLEAWSRGARQVVFVENNPVALAALEANMRRLGVFDAGVVVPRDATRRLAWPAAPAGLVFVDPPWMKCDGDPDLALAALENLIGLGAIADGALLSVEHDHRRPVTLPGSCVLLETRRWGKTAVTLARHAGPGTRPG